MIKINNESFTMVQGFGVPKPKKMEHLNQQLRFKERSGRWYRKPKFPGFSQVTLSWPGTINMSPSQPSRAACFKRVGTWLVFGLTYHSV